MFMTNVLHGNKKECINTLFYIYPILISLHFLFNSNAISVCAKVPPYRPGLEIIPIAFVEVIHFCGDNVKEFSPASFLNPSNSRGLKFGLFIFSHKPRYSMVFLFRSQFAITPDASSGFLYFAMSVKEM